MKKQRIVSGMRPTAKLHLGNMMGALINWVDLQDKYNCTFSVADLHALTTGYEDTESLRVFTREMIIDWISVGLDPEKCDIFVQSHVKGHSELHLLLSMITPLSWLERCPTYKDQLKQIQGRQINTYGFLGYPVLMTSDILLYKAEKVPVGEDQDPHIELCREIARRFNYLYAPVFPEPVALHTKFKVLPGTDGRKMSKSYDNYIEISASPETIKEKVMMMVTDPQKIRKNDPGHPEVCTVFSFYKVFDSKEKYNNLAETCKKGHMGCVQCKRRLADLIIKKMEPINERRGELEKRSDLIDDILQEGAKRSRVIAEQTLEEVSTAMKI